MWYSEHFMRSNHTALFQLTQIAQWLAEHPTEIVVMSISRHGNLCQTGDDAFPSITKAHKNAFFALLLDLLGDYMIDSSVSDFSSTTLADLISRNHRLIIFFTDYKEFTNGSSRVIDGCNISDESGSAIPKVKDGQRMSTQSFENSESTKNKGKFTLMSMATATQSEQMTQTFFDMQLSLFKKSYNGKCTKTFDIYPHIQQCPSTLLDLASITNYYNQFAIEQAALMGWQYPNAIQLDYFQPGGLI